MITLVCACGKVVNVAPELAGKVIPCPACNKEIEIPGLPPAPKAAAAAAPPRVPQAAPTRRAPTPLPRPPVARPATSRPVAAVPGKPTARMTKAPVAAAAPPSRPRDSRRSMMIGMVATMVVVLGVAVFALFHHPKPSDALPAGPAVAQAPAPEPVAAEPATPTPPTTVTASSDPVPPGAPPPSPEKPASWEDVAARCNKGMAWIVTDRGQGRGWVVAGVNLCVTTYHVVGGSSQVAVTAMLDGVKVPVPAARVCAVDVSADLAVISLSMVPGRAGAYDGLSLRIPPNVREGEAVFAFCDLRSGVPSKGEVGEIESGAGGVSGFLVSGLPGLSGGVAGPVLDMQGEVLGVITLQGPVKEEAGFAVDGSSVARLLSTKDPACVVPGPLAAWEKSKAPGAAGAEPSQKDEGDPEKLEDLVERCKKNIVVIMTDRSAGTGWVVAGKSVIITNYHVVAGSTKLRVVLAINGQRLEMQGTRVSAVDPEADLAAISFIQSTKLRDLGGLSLRLPANVRAGESVVVIGNPGGAGTLLDMSVTQGIVSNASRQGANGIEYVQTSAAINPGNSGGPLLDAHGRVLGVVTLKIQGAEGLGFAVAGKHVQNFIDNMDSQYLVRDSLSQWEREHGINPEAAEKAAQPAGGAGGGGVAGQPPQDVPLPEGVSVIDTGGHKILGLWPHPDGKRLFALDSDENGIDVIDLTKKEITSKVFVGSEPVSMVANADKHLLYIACHGSRQVVEFDPSTCKASSTISVAGTPLCVAPTTDHNRFAYLSTDRGTPSIVYFSESGGKGQEQTVGQGFGYCSARALAWLPWANMMVCFTSQGMGQILLMHPEPAPAPPAPWRAGQKPPAQEPGFWSNGWRVMSTAIQEEGNEGSPVLVDPASKTFITAKKKYEIRGKEAVQVGYFKPVDYAAMHDPKMRQYEALFKQLDNLYSLSEDGTLALSATSVYSTKTFLVVKELPFPCAVSAAKGESLYLYDMVSRKIVILPLK